nr:hypothetical protein [Tanacetum cinerariifolium]
DSSWNFVLGKVAEGSGDVMEVVEWPGMEERWGKNVWREIRVLGCGWELMGKVVGIMWSRWSGQEWRRVVGKP